jgi:nucleoid-associated protein YgaU
MIADYAPGLWAPRPRPRVVHRSLLVGAMLAVGAVAGMGGVAYGGSHSGPDTIVVHRGDSLWSIAAARYPGDNVADHVQKIMALNRISAGVVQPGQTLVLPSS